MQGLCKSIDLIYINCWFSVYSNVPHPQYLETGNGGGGGLVTSIYITDQL